MRAASTHSIGWLLALIILAQVLSLRLEVNSATQDGSLPLMVIWPFGSTVADTRLSQTGRRS